MIQCNPLKKRQVDGKQMYTRFAQGYLRKSDYRMFSELPESAEPSDYASLGSTLRVRCDQTGQIYEIAQDPEDTTHTYTEMFPDPADVSEWDIYQVSGTNDYYAVPRFYDYPKYKADTEYHQGDILVAPDTNFGLKVTYICDEESIQGVDPAIWGFSEYLPYINIRTPRYKTLAEIYPENEE